MPYLKGKSIFASVQDSFKKGLKSNPKKVFSKTKSFPRKRTKSSLYGKQNKWGWEI